MTQNTETLRIQLLDKSYPIKCPAEEVNSLQQAALLVDNAMRHVRQQNRQFTLEQTAIAAALKLAIALRDAKAEPAASDIAQGLKTLQAKVDDALTEQKQLDVEEAIVENS